MIDTISAGIVRFADGVAKVKHILQEKESTLDGALRAPTHQVIFFRVEICVKKKQTNKKTTQLSNI